MQTATEKMIDLDTLSKTEVADFNEMAEMRKKVPQWFKRSLNKSDFDLLSKYAQYRSKDLGEQLRDFGAWVMDAYAKQPAAVYGMCIRDTGREMINNASFPQFLDEYERCTNNISTYAAMVQPEAKEVAERALKLFGKCARLAVKEEKRYVPLYKILSYEERA